MEDSLSIVSIEEDEVVVPSEPTNSLLNLSNQLAVAVADLGKRVSSNGGNTGILHTQPVPTLPKFSGQPRNGQKLLEWVRDARENIEQLSLQGQAAVTYLCRYLERPALTRVRNSGAGTAEEIFACLENAFGQKRTYLELEAQLRERVQKSGEGAWEFADAIKEIEEQMHRVRPRPKEDREWTLRTWFCRNLSNRRIGVKMQEWWEKHPEESWEGLVQKVDDKVREEERIEREERERHRMRGSERMIRGVQRSVTAPPCVLCKREGHLGYQCEEFPTRFKGRSGNEQP